MAQSAFKKALPVLFGNTLEAYDFCLYGLLAPLFSKIFFPPDFKYSLVAAFAVFAIAYLSRPLGSVFWGHIADKYGRKPVLIGTLTMMAIPAITMACIPSYQSIGIISCIVIIILRIIQGIAFGGEFPTSMVILYELAPANRKGLFSSLLESIASMGNLIGVLFIFLLSYVMGDEIFNSWGWRILFIISLIFIFLVGYIRSNLVETITITKDNQNYLPVIEVFKRWKSLIKIILYLFAGNVLFFSYVYHMNIFIKNNLPDISSTLSSIVNALMMIYLIILLPVVSYLSDIIGRIITIKTTLFILSVFSYPIYYFVLSNSFLYFIFGILLLGLFVAIIVGLSLSVVVENSYKNCLVSMSGISHGAAIILFGATTPMINEYLIISFDSPYAPASLLFLSSVVSLLSIFSMHKTRSH